MIDDDKMIEVISVDIMGMINDMKFADENWLFRISL